MAKTKRHNELAAGIFLVLALAGIFVVLVMVADFSSLFEQTRQYQVAFALDQNIDGLIPGAAVKLGGYKIGNVTAVQPELLPVRPRADAPPAPASRPAEQANAWYLLATIRIPSRYALARDGLAVELARPIIGTDAILNIANVGAGTPVADGEVIDGQIASASFLADAAKTLGFGENEREAVQQAVDHVRNLTASLEESGREIEMLLKQGGDIRHIITNVGAAGEKLTGIMANVDTTVVSIRDMVGKDGVVMRIAADIEKAAQQAVAILEENRKTIQDAIANAARTTGDAADMARTLKQQLTPLLAKVDSALVTANQALAGFRDLTATANTLMQRNQVPISATIDDYRIMAGNLKATSAEIRANPWRLLYQPTEKDKQIAAINDAARNFATGAGQLDNAVQVLATLTASPEGSPLADTPEVKEALEVLKNSVANYRKVERYLLKEAALK